MLGSSLLRGWSGDAAAAAVEAVEAASNSVEAAAVAAVVVQVFLDNATRQWRRRMEQGCS